MTEPPREMISRGIWKENTMKKIDLARAMRDEDYYLSLTDGERASLPIHPSAMLEVSDDALRATVGGATSIENSCGITPICTFCGGRPCA